MTPTTQWFSGREGLDLWKIEHDAIREALPGATTGQSLLIGPAIQQQNLLKDMAFGQCWQFNPAISFGNPWLSDDYSSLPLQDECMGLIVLRHCMNADEKSRHLLFDACRVLSPGGHIVLCCLNSSGWLGLGLRRKKRLPGLSAGWLRSASRQTGLTLEHIGSYGLGGLSSRYSSRLVHPLVSALSNLHICILSRQSTGGEIRRLVFKLPRRGRSVAANTGVYSKTGT